MGRDGNLARSISVDNNNYCNTGTANNRTNQTSNIRTPSLRNLYRHKSFDQAVTEFKRQNDQTAPKLDEVIYDSNNNNDQNEPILKSRLAKTITIAE